ncbi:MAG TPA: hypothetical protein DHU96_32640, partial [Actinobacteria bacterium]|nr:hypothetical protein [Actinomycetota bacterium]
MRLTRSRRRNQASPFGRQHAASRPVTVIEIGFMGASLCAGREDWLPSVAAWDCGVLPGGLVAAPRRKGPVIPAGRAGQDVSQR